MLKFLVHLLRRLLRCLERLAPVEVSASVKVIDIVYDSLKRPAVVLEGEATYDTGSGPRLVSLTLRDLAANVPGRAQGYACTVMDVTGQLVNAVTARVALTDPEGAFRLERLERNHSLELTWQEDRDGRVANLEPAQTTAKPAAY
jgi:hypothetical protein